MIYILSVLRIISLFVLIFSTVMLLPIAVDLWYQEGNYKSFVNAFLITFFSGGIGLAVFKKHQSTLHLKEAFLIVVLVWFVISAFSALPFYLLDFLKLDVSTAVFEAVSGLTTTGATTLSNLDDMPRAFLLYRHFLQWCGGLGIILIALIILPLLGIGGMQIYRTEAPSAAAGIGGDNLVRVKDMARMLWGIYLLLTIICAFSYYLAGMSIFDAICHSFSTVSIGGFSTHDSSFGYFAEQPTILLVAIIFMILSATSFSLHFLVWQRKSLVLYWENYEFKTLIVLLLIMVSFTSLFLFNANMDDEMIKGLFQAVSITTTTGFVSTQATNWPGVIMVLLLFASFVGGCAGSTAGGIKIVRFILLLKQGVREMRQLIHPDAITPLKLGNTVLRNKTIQSVWGFFSAYIASLILVTLILMATGLNQESSFSAAAAMLNNLGPGLGEVSQNYSSVSTTAKWVMSFTMLLGRLEIFALIIIFSPVFWRK